MSETEAMTLTEFLLARIAEDEAVARDYAPEEYPNGVAVGIFGWSDLELMTVNPDRVLAECAAKRRIVTTRLAISPAYGAPAESLEALHNEVQRQREDVLRALASVYADHPDYRQEWTP